MKKAFYIIMIVIASSLTMTSCIEDDVKPASTTPRQGSGGGASFDPL